MTMPLPRPAASSREVIGRVTGWSGGFAWPSVRACDSPPATRLAESCAAGGRAVTIRALSWLVSAADRAAPSMAAAGAALLLLGVWVGPGSGSLVVVCWLAA